MYGCYNRAEFKREVIVQEGSTDGKWKQITIPFVMSETCQYTLSNLGKVDPKCNGCRWKQ